MIYELTLNTKDKINALATLIEEINNQKILEDLNKDSKIKKLKSTCHDIDFFINKSIEYYKREYLREERICLLIDHSIKLKEIQKSYELELTSLGTKRCIEEEYQINKAFDFELSSINDLDEKPLLSNATEIEKRIRDSINNNIFKPILSNYDKAWFKIGLLLANGELTNIHKNSNKNFSKTTRVLVDKIGIKESDRPYISESINENKSSKNIYKNKKYMETIFNYCTEKKIKITNDFKEKYNSLNT